MNQLPVTDLATVGEGAAMEKFDREWSRLLDNVRDVNTDPTAPRSVTLTIELHPKESRDGGRVIVKARSKLAPHRPHEATVFIGQKQGRLVSVGFDPRQMDAFPETRDEDVLPLHEQAKKAEGGSE